MHPMHLAKRQPVERHGYLQAVQRYWLLAVIALFGALVLFTKPVAWAAPVATPANQTVPTADFIYYLPIILRTE